MLKRLHIVSIARSLPDPTDPSAGIFILNRLQAMAQYADVTVVQPVPYLPGVKPLPEWARAESRRLGPLEIRHAPMFYVPGILKSLDGAWLARAIAPIVSSLNRERPIDVLDAHFGYPEGVGTASVAARLGVPLFITIRGFEKEFASRFLVGAKMLHAMRSATGCIAVSHSLHDLAVRHGVSPDRMRVIHNAIDAATFRYSEAGGARRLLDVGSAGPLVVSVGHLISRKRHHVLIEAFAEFKRNHPNALLAIIGARSFEPQYPDRLRELSRSLSIESAVRFVGNVPPGQVAVWLQAADLFALATAREGCCNAVLEALAAGTPVVTTPAGDNAYFVKDGENGAIAPIDDVATLARAMSKVAVAPWDRPAIARALAAKAGSWKGVGGRVIEFMNERLEKTAADVRRGAALAN